MKQNKENDENKQVNHIAEIPQMSFRVMKTTCDYEKEILEFSVSGMTTEDCMWSIDFLLDRANLIEVIDRGETEMKNTEKETKKVKTKDKEGVGK